MDLDNTVVITFPKIETIKIVTNNATGKEELSGYWYFLHDDFVPQRNHELNEWLTFRGKFK